MLNVKNIKIKRLNKELDQKNLGLFKITRVINNVAYKLRLLFIIVFIFPIFYL